MEDVMPTAKEYYEGILKQAGVADAKRQALVAVLDDDEISKALNSDVIAPRLRQEDYSRNQDALKAEKDKAAKEWQEYYQKELTRVANDKKVLDQYAARVQAYEQQYGSIDDGKVITQQVQSDFLKKEDVDKMLQQQGNQMLTILEWVGQKPIQHYKTFGEPLDVSAVKKIAMEKGVSLDQAYAEYSSPMAEARQKAEVEKRVADAKAEGAREFASTHKLPIDAKPREYHPIFDRQADAKPVTERDRANAFADAWNNAGATSGGNQ